MKLRFPIFTDPIYTADKIAEFEARDVANIEEKQVSLLMRGSFWVTDVTLQNGSKYRLNNRVADQIEAAQNSSHND